MFLVIFGCSTLLNTMVESKLMGIFMLWGGMVGNDMFSDIFDLIKQ